ncbi:MAG: cyclase family protein [Chlamydiia bacterium]|nr:cyclase family protein [Chlamydiia bacterium]
MKIYDISLTLSESIPTWRADPKPQFRKTLSLEKGEVANVSHMSLCVHAGTHVDAPCHFLKGGSTVETLPLEILVGKAVVIEAMEADRLTQEVFEKASIPPDTERLLVKTGNSKEWEKGATEFIEDYVGVSADGAKYLVEKGIKLIGVDYLSVAPLDEIVPTHETLLKGEVVIIEGLNLSKIEPGTYTLYCLPLKIAGSDGAPARVILTSE